MRHGFISRICRLLKWICSNQSKFLFNMDKDVSEWIKKREQDIAPLKSLGLTWCLEIQFSTFKTTMLVQVIRPPVGRTLCSTSPLPNQLTSPLCFPSHVAPTSTPPLSPAQEESVPLQRTSVNSSTLPYSLYASLPTSSSPLSSSHLCLASRPHRFHVWAAHIDFYAGSWIIPLLPLSQ